MNGSRRIPLGAPQSNSMGLSWSPPRRTRDENIHLCIGCLRFEKLGVALAALLLIKEQAPAVCTLFKASLKDMEFLVSFNSKTFTIPLSPYSPDKRPPFPYSSPECRKAQTRESGRRFQWQSSFDNEWGLGAPQSNLMVLT
ncbi:hypothetical protein CDAR_208271 [Caerostris darwini]|uniref:Uncharacterized protein n=1 Tax=Caerostris darwini TaxID=1538125 RepID=A0AAV4RFC9_9ARAC|nr:hypothetical protein CDAR_208271 [Caerostris darwini]